MIFFSEKSTTSSDTNGSSTSSSKKKCNRLESAIQRLAQNALNVASEDNSNEGSRQEPPRKEPGNAVEDLLMNEESLETDEVHKFCMSTKNVCNSI